MKYIYFKDLHGDECGGTVEVTEKEFALLLPYSDDMVNCNPLPDELHDLLWEKIYARNKMEEVELDPHSIEEKDILVQSMA